MRRGKNRSHWLGRKGTRSRDEAQKYPVVWGRREKKLPGVESCIDDVTIDERIIS